MQLRRQQVTAQVLRSLPLAWETQLEFPIGLVQAWLL